MRLFILQKDSFERMLKENGALKEKRAFPEKMEELDRYRSRVLEYSKCITALRQAALVSVFCSAQLISFHSSYAGKRSSIRTACA